MPWFRVLPVRIGLAGGDAQGKMRIGLAGGDARRVGWPAMRQKNARGKMRMTRRLYSLGGLALVAVGVLVAASIHFADETNRAARQLYDYSLSGVVNAADLELLLEKHRRIVETSPIELDRNQIVRDTFASEAIVDQLEALATTRDDDAGSIAGELPELVAKGRRVLFYASQFAQDRAIGAAAEYNVVAGRVHDLIAAYRGRRLAVADAQVTGLARSGRQLMTWLLVTAVVAMILIGPFSFLVIHGIVVRLKRITDVMLRLARNDTTVIVTSLADADEVGDMARAVQVFKANAIALIDNRQQLEHANRRLDVAVNNMMRGLSMFDCERRLTVCNQHYATLYGLPPELRQPGTPLAAIVEHGIRTEATETAGRNRATPPVATVPEIEVLDPVQPPTADRTATFEPWHQRYAKMIAAGQHAVLTNTMPDGRIIDVTCQPLGDGGWVEVHEDVTTKNKAEAREAELARRDTVTRLANRLRFREALETAFQRQHQGIDFAVLCIDLDHFKAVNDTLGHPVGDALLQAVADRLRQNTRPTDLVARLGGDEFTVIQSNIAGSTQAGVLAGRLVDRVSAPYEIGGHSIIIGASVGIALAPADGGDADHLLKNADMALYRAKAMGRGTHCFFKPEMEGEVRERRALELDLRKALELGQLELFYQPLVNLADHRASGLEALLRWRHPERGLVSPAKFISLAEERGLIVPIGSWALATACRQAAEWPSHLRVSVNLSVVQFKSGDLERDVRSALTASGLAPGRLELEVTESLLLNDDAATIGLLHRLKALGVTIALDDSGTGYSSLSYLRSFPFDKIKIDQTFVRDISNRRDCVAIVRAVAGLAQTLNMRTVAEGVETIDHLERVRAAGCDEVQGYFFSKPVPASQVLSVVANCEHQFQTAA